MQLERADAGGLPGRNMTPGGWRLACCSGRWGRIGAAQAARCSLCSPNPCTLPSCPQCDLGLVGPRSSCGRCHAARREDQARLAQAAQEHEQRCAALRAEWEGERAALERQKQREIEAVKQQQEVNQVGRGAGCTGTCLVPGRALAGCSWPWNQAHSVESGLAWQSGLADRVPCIQRSSAFCLLQRPLLRAAGGVARGR